MVSQSVNTNANESMARFRSSLLRRSSAVAWVVLIIIGYQAVRSPREDGTQLITQPEFYVPMAGMVLLLLFSTASRWDRIMRTAAAPFAAAGWLLAVITGIAALALIPELTATAQPILFGIAAVSGLLLVWWPTPWSR